MPAKPASRLQHVRQFCLSLPEVVEAEQFGYPWWKAGKKSFACGGQDDLSVNLTLELQDIMLQDSRFTKTHYVGHHGWVSFSLKEVDEATTEKLLLEGYRKVALKRMLAALAAR
jgi:hypothetical protein